MRPNVNKVPVRYWNHRAEASYLSQCRQCRQLRRKVGYRDRMRLCVSPCRIEEENQDNENNQHNCRHQSCEAAQKIWPLFGRHPSPLPKTRLRHRPLPSSVAGDQGSIAGIRIRTPQSGPLPETRVCPNPPAVCIRPRHAPAPLARPACQPIPRPDPPAHLLTVPSIRLIIDAQSIGRQLAFPHAVGYICTTMHK